MAHDYKKIVAWQRAHQLTIAIYQRTRGFPAKERFGLTNQLRRAALGVPANISEGSGRGGNKEFLHFLTISRASLKETEYFLLLARDLGYLAREEHRLLGELVNRTFAALHGLIKTIRKASSG